MGFKLYRDSRPMVEREPEVQVEAALFGLVRTFLSKKDQGRVMGAFRDAIKDYKVEKK